MRNDEETGCYVNHLVAQHKRLHGILRDMRRAIVASLHQGDSPTFSTIDPLLVRMRDEVASHFREEEAGGCLDEAVSRCPSLSSTARRIEAEHPHLLEQIDRLCEKARSLPPTPPNQEAIQCDVDTLTRELLAHEAAENRLLAQGFGNLVNGEDADELAATDEA